MLMASNLYKGVFLRATEILGGKEQLAAHLKVDLERLRKWSSNSSRPPVQVLQSLAELLKQELMKKYAGNSRTRRRKKAPAS
jgi:ribosome-binding protein aMBF1 (putative translation factor)